MPVATTYAPGYNRANDELTQLPFLRENEFAGICDALADGQLVALVRTSRSCNGAPTAEIVGAVTPGMADQMTSRDPDIIDELRDELREATRELANLKTIAGEVMAEKIPADFLWRIDGAADDVQRAIDGAINHAEDL